MIAQSAPDTYNTNALSSQRCADYGEKLLAEIQRGGMTDALDKQCADYIDKSKRTLKAMNERRSPITKLFDQIRSEFTGMENTIDPTKKDTVPYKIQQARNAYAAKKREEAERARQEEMRRQQREQALNRYKQESEDDYRRQFDNLVTEKSTNSPASISRSPLRTSMKSATKSKSSTSRSATNGFSSASAMPTNPTKLPMRRRSKFASLSSTVSPSSSKTSFRPRSENTATLSLTLCPQRKRNLNAWRKPMPKSRHV